MRRGGFSRGSAIMEQFYCLSVVLNILAGLILVYGMDLTKKSAGSISETVDLSKDEPEKKLIPGRRLPKNLSGLNDRGLRLVAGIAASCVGIVKLFCTYKNIPVLGDFIPSLAGIAGGLSILIEYYAANVTDDDFELSDSMQAIFINPRRYIGVACLVAALLHFIFPRAIFL